MHGDRKNISSFSLFRDVTDDEAFVDELRVTLRFFAAVLVRRTQKVKKNLAKLDCKPGPIMILKKNNLFLLSQVDVASLITQKLLKVSMKHIEIISKARQKGDGSRPVILFTAKREQEPSNWLFSPAVKSAEYLQQAALEEYGPDLHVALRSRRDELLYFRKLTEMLFPYILPPKATDCR